MRQKMNFVLFVSTEDKARQRAMKMYARLKNLTVDSIKPYHRGGYQIYISYDKEDTK